MSLKNGDRFTIYDAMEASGAFSRNPANANSRDEGGRSLYAGPVKFPMMVYHPQGEEEVIVPGTKERTDYGTVEMFGEQKGLVSRVVEDEKGLAEALGDGWHKHPALAIKAGNETWRKAAGLRPRAIPAISAGSLIADLEERNRKLSEALEEAKRSQAEMVDATPFVPPAGGKSASNVAKAGLV